MKNGVELSEFGEKKLMISEREIDWECVRELAMEISLTSLGSSQTLPLPHLRTLAASRFWSFRDTISLSLSLSLSGGMGERNEEARCISLASVRNPRFCFFLLFSCACSARYFNLTVYWALLTILGLTLCHAVHFRKYYSFRALIFFR